MSKYFSEDAINDADWMLKVLKRIVRVADDCQAHPLLSGPDKAAEMRSAHDAITEAIATHPQSDAIRAFAAERGL